MRLHHIGIATKSIERELQEYQKILGGVEQVSNIVYDTVQEAWLCIIELKSGGRLELVEGKPVEPYLAKGIRMYHMCYEVDNLEAQIELLKNLDGILISGPDKAILFGGRRVAFLYTRIGLIELMEERG